MESLGVILSSASSVFSCLMPVYTFWLFFPLLLCLDFPPSVCSWVPIPLLLHLDFGWIGACLYPGRGETKALLQHLKWGCWAECCSRTARNGPANLLLSSFTQPEVTCIEKGCLHTTCLNCFGCLQISVFALKFIFWYYVGCIKNHVILSHGQLAVLYCSNHR